MYANKAFLACLASFSLASTSTQASSLHSSHTCVVRSRGKVKCWGKNTYGQLGLSHTNDMGDDAFEMGGDLPEVDLGSGRSAKSVFTGDDFSCAILDNGKVACWGRNYNGELGNGLNGTDDAYGNSIDFDTFSRSHIGDQLYEMGDNLTQVDFGEGRRATYLALGEAWSCALLDNGQVRCWGSNKHGILGIGNTESLKTLPSSPVDLGKDRRALSISSGYYRICAILDTGDVVCWGLGDFDAYPDNPAVGDEANEMGDNLVRVALGSGRKAKQISAGIYQTCAILDNDDLVCWGNQHYGELGIGSNETIGTVLGNTAMTLQPVDLGTGRKAKQVFAGYYTTCAIRDTNDVVCWGAQLGSVGYSSPRVGDDPEEMGDHLVPIHLGDGRTCNDLLLGRGHMCAVLDQDDIVCWGYNYYGQLGRGNADSVDGYKDDLLPIDFSSDASAHATPRPAPILFLAILTSLVFL